MIEGEKWITLGREEIGKAGLTSKDVSDKVKAFPKNMNFVFAAYSPETTTMHVEVHRIGKQPMARSKFAMPTMEIQ